MHQNLHMQVFFILKMQLINKNIFKNFFDNYLEIQRVYILITILKWFPMDSNITI